MKHTSNKILYSVISSVKIEPLLLFLTSTKRYIFTISPRRLFYVSNYELHIMYDAYE